MKASPRYEARTLAAPHVAFGHELVDHDVEHCDAIGNVANP